MMQDYDPRHFQFARHCKGFYPEYKRPWRTRVWAAAFLAATVVILIIAYGAFGQ